jgi:hypothetical protein
MKRPDARSFLFDIHADATVSNQVTRLLCKLCEPDLRAGKGLVPTGFIGDLFEDDGGDHILLGAAISRTFSRACSSSGVIDPPRSRREEWLSEVPLVTPHQTRVAD